MTLPADLHPALLAIKTRLQDSPNSPVMVAIAGPPAAGKSTLAEAMQTHFTAEGVACALLPMDGFHLDNAVLEEKGLLARKGSPASFDVHGFIALVQRAKRGKLGTDAPVYAPRFERRWDISVASATEISNHELILIEGNYLLYNQPPWDVLHGLWDISLWLDVPLDVIESRCMARWQSHGLDSASAQKRTQGNDLINARMVLENSRVADFILGLTDGGLTDGVGE